MRRRLVGQACFFGDKVAFGARQLAQLDDFRRRDADGWIGVLSAKIAELDAKVREQARENEDAKRPAGIPGVGPTGAMAVQAFAPPMEDFRRGRDLSAWLGLVPRQYATGGKPRLGKVSKMGRRDPGRLLAYGAMSAIRWAERRGTDDPRLESMMKRKPKMVVAVALANKTARRIQAMTADKENFRVPGAAREGSEPGAAGGERKTECWCKVEQSWRRDRESRE